LGKASQPIARLGRHQQYRRITIAGFVPPLIAFVFMTIASFERAMERKEQAQMTPSRNATAAPSSRPHQERIITVTVYSFGSFL
jgi:hypothetical protein